MDLGIPVSVNTDDTETFNTTLAGEFEALQRHLGFVDFDIETLLDNAIDMAWCDEALKRTLRERVRGFRD